MTEREFCYWLQGFIELSDPTAMTAEQVGVVREHLSLVFKKDTPSRPFGPASVSLTPQKATAKFGFPPTEVEVAFPPAACNLLHPASC